MSKRIAEAIEKLQSLSERELCLLLIAEDPNSSIFGGPGGDTIVITVTTGRTRTKTEEAWTRTQEQKVLTGLVKRGWLRFSRGPDEERGYYFLTDSAKMILQTVRKTGSL